MDANTALVLAGCGLLVVIGGLILLGAFVMYKLLRINVVSALLGWFMRGDDDRVPEQPYSAQLAPHRRADELRAKAAALDFDEAVAQYQRQPNPDVNVTGTPQVAQDAGLEDRPMNTSSPITGRIMRDGRFRRVTGGTPGRKVDQDFRRVEGGDPPGGYAELPPPPASSPLRSRRRDRNEDEIFGGKLDEDGDGTLDF